MSGKDILKAREENRSRYFKTQMEKEEYLGEYKEKVLAALKKNQLEEDDPYPEILKLLKNPNACLLKMRRDVSLSKLKPYIKEAEKLKVRYQLIDGLSYKGDIALVVVSEDVLNNKEKNVIVRDMDQDFLDVGLTEMLSKARGKKICKVCYKKLQNKLPKYLYEYSRMGLFDKMVGNKCPGCGNK